MKSRYWPEMSCVISLQHQKYKHKNIGQARHHLSPYPPSPSRQQKLEISWQKLLWDHMASLFTLLRTFLCYMTFLFSSKYGAVFSFGLLSNIYIFFFLILDISSFHTRKTLRLQRKFCFLPFLVVISCCRQFNFVNFFLCHLCVNWVFIRKWNFLSCWNFYWVSVILSLTDFSCRKSFYMK